MLDGWYLSYKYIGNVKYEEEDAGDKENSAIRFIQQQISKIPRHMKSIAQVE